MSEKFIFSHDAPRGYGGDTLRTLNNRINPLKQANSLAEGAVTQWGVACNPPYYSHQNGVVCVMEITHLTPDWCECVRGGWSA